jgi:hypothetical protein
VTPSAMPMPSSISTSISPHPRCSVGASKRSDYPPAFTPKKVGPQGRQNLCAGFRRVPPSQQCCFASFLVGGNGQVATLGS